MPCRPAEYMTVSAGIFLPLSRIVTVPLAYRSTAVTVSPNRNVTARSRRWYFSASTTSVSQNSSIRIRCSTTVTLVPSAANIDAYSMPITPAPTTIMVRGILSRPRMPSESMIVCSSKSTVAGRAGLVPVAITIFSAVTWRSWPVPSVTCIVCGSTNRPSPGSSATPLRASWLRITSTSRPTTCVVRAVRSPIVMSSLTR